MAASKPIPWISTLKNFLSLNIPFKTLAHNLGSFPLEQMDLITHVLTTEKNLPTLESFRNFGKAVRPPKDLLTLPSVKKSIHYLNNFRGKPAITKFD